jgi:hypothetical protein
MAVIDTVLGAMFGGGRNILRDTAEVFRENAEAGADREAALRQAALAQFAAEFALERQSWFDRAVDGANRLPRPLMALGTMGLFGAAMTDPVWFASRMQGIALVPEPLWWLLGAIVSFYFGARHQAKGQEFQIRVARSLGHAPQVVDNLRRLRALEAGAYDAADEAPAFAPDAAAHGQGAEDGPARRMAASVADDDNPALAAWRGSARPHEDPLGGR